MFIAGVASIDFGALRVYRYLLLSDVLLILALVLQARRGWNGKLYYPKFVALMFLLYLTSTAVTFVRPLDPALGLFTWLHSAFLMLVYVPTVTTLLVLRPDLRPYALVALVASLTVQAVIIGYAVVTGLYWQSGTRIAGVFGSAQFWPYAASAVGAVALLATRSWPTKVAATLSLAVLAAAEIFFRSRMLWIATILGAGGFLVMQSRNKWRGVAAATAVCMIFAAGYALDLYPSAVQTRIAATLRPMESGDLVARLRVAQDAVDILIDSPLVGVGVAQSAEHLRALPVPPLILNVHNIVLHAAVEGGIGAAMSLVMLPVGILLLWRAGLQAHPEPFNRVLLNWACASLLAIYVSAQLTPTLYEHTFYFLLALLASMAWRGSPVASYEPSVVLNDSAGSFRTCRS